MTRRQSWGIAVIALFCGGAGALAFWAYYSARPTIHDTPYAGLPSGVRVLRSGAELEISGPITDRLAGQFHDILQTHTQARTVQLDSPGGEVHAALQIATDIRGRHLATFVGNLCQSACILAFMAGDRRWVGAFAHLLLERSVAGEALLPAYRTAGVNTDILSGLQGLNAGQAEAISTTQALETGIATDSADRDTFALAGFGPDPKAADIERRLRDVPVYNAVAILDPQGFQQDLLVWTNVIREGVPGTAAFEALQSRIGMLFRRLLYRAPDSDLLEYGNLLVDEVVWINANAPNTCEEMLINGQSTATSLPTDFILRRADIFSHILLAGQHDDPSAAVRAEDKPARVDMYADLSNRGVDPRLLEAFLDDPAANAIGCRQALVFLQSALKRPRLYTEMMVHFIPF
jgi:hypothetical protein